MEQTKFGRWRGWMFEGVSPFSLVFFRVLFGVLMFVGMLRFFVYGWIEEFYVRPVFHFTYLGFSWVRPWSSLGMHIHFGVLGVLSLCIALGLFYRGSVLLFFLGFTYIELIDKTNYLNHYYLVSLLSFVMFFLPLHRSFSLDVWRRPGLGLSTFPRWSLWLVRGQVGIVYVFAGIAKLKSDWLFGGQPLHLWLSTRGTFPVLGLWFQEKWLAVLMSWAGALFDLSVVFFLSWRRTRALAYCAVVIFHLMTAKLFAIGMFPWLMMGFALIFFPPDWPWQLAHWFQLKGERESAVLGERGEARAQPCDRHLPEGGVPGFLRWFGLCAWGAYFLVQVLVPLRHHLYRGNVCWREEGFRFSWKVMLIEKTGFVEFRLMDPETKERWSYSPRRMLTPLQVKMMSTQPDMILTFAHELAARFRRKGHPKIEVRVDAFASLNGRPSQRFLDPTVDLAKEKRGWAPKRWILPLENHSQKQWTVKGR